MSKEQLEHKYHLASLKKGFVSQLFFKSGVGSECAHEIQRENGWNLQEPPRLADLIHLYLVLEELGAAWEIKKPSLSPKQKEEWVSLVCLSQEMILRETGPEETRPFYNPEVYLFYRHLHQQLLTENRTLISQKPPNVFWSLSFIMRGQMEKVGVEFPQLQQTIRDDFREELKKANPNLKHLLEIMTLPELVNAPCAG